MSQHLLTFELSPDGDELFLHGDEAGLRYLSTQLLRLADHAARGEFEHTHLMTDAWGGDGLSGQPQSETDTLLNHVKVYGWPKQSPR